jgi:hypothetical protein
MTPPRRILLLVALATGAATVAVAIASAFRLLSIGSPLFVALLSGLLATMAVSYAALFVRTLSANPTTLRVALVGAPGSGKTVYLTVLFSKLEAYQDGAVSFRPYGVDTVEAVSRNLSLLKQGQWLPRTALGTVSYFRASATFGRGLFASRHTVEFGDYAGEQAQEFSSASEQWLHRSDYFKYVLSSDIVFLAVDATLLTESGSYAISEVQDRLAAVLNLMADDKGIPADRKMRIPVALLVLKADVLGGGTMAEQRALEKLDRLVSIGSIRCSAFQPFFVSSIGNLASSDRPPDTIKPIRVLEPLIWAISRIHG